MVVLALVLYGMSARDPSESPDWMDRIQLVAVVSALVLDVMVLGAMIARIGDLGFSPNRTAALGLNLVLLVNLAGAAWLSAQFLRRRSRLHRLERWQTTYLPVFALWAAAVVVVAPAAVRLQLIDCFSAAAARIAAALRSTSSTDVCQFETEIRIAARPCHWVPESQHVPSS